MGERMIFLLNSNPFYSSHSLTHTQPMNNSELSIEKLETCSGGAAWIPAGYIIAKEGTKAVPFYKDLYRNLKDGKCVGAAVVAADHSSGTIEKN